MKKITLIILAVCLVSIPLLSCASKSASEPVTQTATVRRGDLETDITGVGNLALSDKVDLAFQMDGTVAEVLVEEGDSVKEGQLLAKLDASAWEDYITGLEDKVTAAERNVTTKERAVTTAERTVTTRKLDQLQTQSNLQTTEDNLNKISVIGDAQKAVDDAEYDSRIAQAMFQQASLSVMSTDALNFWVTQINLAQQRLADAQKELKEIQAGSSVKVTTDVATAVAINNLQVEIARGRLEDAQTAIEDAKKSVGDAQTAVGDAKKALDAAKKTLDDAKNTSPEVTASFAGFITKVNVKGGDIVKKGMVAVTLANPIRFEAEVMVSEANIAKVKVGGVASVQVEALPGASLSANVTHIAPTATVQSGVVNYKVKVEIEPFQSAASGQRPATGNLSSGNVTLPRQPTGGSVFSGNATSPRQSTGGNVFSGNVTPSRQGVARVAQGQIPTTLPSDLQLKEGMTVTVSLIVQQRNNVLLIPNAAITTKGEQASVQVLTPSGSTEQRTIQAGISNFQYTEITSGLSEGEQVILPKATTTSTTSQQGGAFRMPGVGGFGR